MKKRNKIFMDHASATPILPEVLAVMRPFLTSQFANPSAIYERGVEASNALERARADIAKILHAHSNEIVFTGSGTEADNLAIFGTVEHSRKQIKRPHIIVSKFEHPAVLEAAEKLERNGAEITYLFPDKDGFVSPIDLKKELKGNTVLVSIMYANNEIGTIQPIREIAKVIRNFRKSQLRRPTSQLPYFHTDATAAANYLSLNTVGLHVDLMAIDASKVYGPKGAGILFVRRGVGLLPQIVGGGQEGGKRSGTENIPAIIGAAKVLSIIEKDKEKESNRLIKLRDFAIEEMLKIFKGAKLNGSLKNRLPNNINICLPNLDSEFAVIKLDTLGIECSSSSSCRSLSENSNSYVIEAIGSKKCAEHSLRFTFGRNTTKKDVGMLLRTLRKLAEST